MKDLCYLHVLIAMRRASQCGQEVCSLGKKDKQRPDCMDFMDFQTSQLEPDLCCNAASFLRSHRVLYQKLTCHIYLALANLGGILRASEWQRLNSPKTSEFVLAMRCTFNLHAMHQVISRELLTIWKHQSVH